VDPYFSYFNFEIVYNSVTYTSFLLSYRLRVAEFELFEKVFDLFQTKQICLNYRSDMKTELNVSFVLTDYNVCFID